MSVRVELDQLARTMAEYGAGYLLTVSDDGRPHAVAVDPVLADGRVVADAAGRRTRANVEVRAGVTLLFPPPQPGGYSLIVDGRGVVEGEQVTVEVEHAVLHRPADHATGPTGSTCGNDCVPLPAG